MPVQLQLRRGASVLNDAFTGADGELSVNTDTKSIVSHDGAKQGGYEIGMPQAKGIIDLRSHTPTASGFRYLKYHTIAGDGGHGVFRAVTGAAVGTYVDNNATIIVPTGGNGSTAWIRNPLRNDEAGLDANGEVIQAQAGAAAQVAAGLGLSSKRADGTWSKKAVNLGTNYPLQTWTDTLVVGVLYGLYIGTPQNGLPRGWWYVEVLRHVSDITGNRWQVIRCTSFGTGGNTSNLVYQSTCAGGGWTPFIKTVMNKPLVWTTPTLVNGWVDYGGIYAIKYTKDDNGTVFIHGLVKGGSNTANTNIFTLPVGYRPALNILCAGGTSGGAARFDVTNNGMVYLIGAEPHTGNATLFLSLETSFKAA